MTRSLNKNQAARFALDGGQTEGPHRRVLPRLLFVAAVLTYCAGAASAPVALRVALALAAALAAAGTSTDPKRTRASRVYLEIDALGLYRVRAGAKTTLLEWRAAGGVTVLANCAGSHLLLAFTTHERTRYVRVTTEGATLGAFRWLGARAIAIADADLVGMDENECLQGDDAMSLLMACDREAPGLVGRIYFTTPRGEPVELTADRLKVGVHALDLRAPLEWRAITFHETAGALTTVYQGTSIAQAGRRFTFVAPMQGELFMGGDFRSAARRDPTLRPRVMDDLRLLQAVPETPPPADERVAMERLFVVPLRRALLRAPRARRTGTQDLAGRAPHRA